MDKVVDSLVYGRLFRWNSGHPSYIFTSYRSLFVCVGEHTNPVSILWHLRCCEQPTLWWAAKPPFFWTMPKKKPSVLPLHVSWVPCFGNFGRELIEHHYFGCFNPGFFGTNLILSKHGRTTIFHRKSTMFRPFSRGKHLFQQFKFNHPKLAAHPSPTLGLPAYVTKPRESLRTRSAAVLKAGPGRVRVK